MICNRCGQRGIKPTEGAAHQKVCPGTLEEQFARASRRLSAADALARAVDAALDDATLAPHAVEEMLRAALSTYRRAGGTKP